MNKKIEVATSSHRTSKEKGDLLEKLAAKFLITQNYLVQTQLRFTGCEIDLLCKSTLSTKEIYVECKAQRENIDANILKNLLGTVNLKDYSEGWLISTAPLGKEAKGFIAEWSQKDKSTSSKLSFITPDKLITSLISSGTVINPDKIDTKILNLEDNRLNDWTLVVTDFGEFWVLGILEGGFPTGVSVFYANNGMLVSEEKLLQNIKNTDTTLKGLDFFYITHKSNSSTINSKDNIAPVQQGDSWEDYRPARPEDFIGREDSQQKILDLFESILEKKTLTRVFAITGNSGMGKSSLIAKLRDKVRNKHYRNKYFLYAVDVRAATNHTYILSALIKCFQEAMNANFISKQEIKIDDYSNPLGSESLQPILRELEQENKIISLVFDQFEELYSKSELFAIFENAQKLFFSANSAQANFCLGFAWKTDSTVPQEHPAYHMWHNMKDNRMEITLRPLADGEIQKIITSLGKAIGRKIPKELNNQLILHSQGFPWLIKKFCIHLYENTNNEVSLESLVDENLDIGVLFDKDIQPLSTPEKTCLKIIAEKAPADWYEILETSSHHVLDSLINKRLVIKSGDRINIYWDIFREYILTKKIPTIPFNYLPTSSSLNTFLKAAEELDHTKGISMTDISKAVNIEEKTAGNVIGDLIMFGIAKGKRNSVILHERIQNNDINSIGLALRITFQKHSIVKQLYSSKQSYEINIEDLMETLKIVYPTAEYANQTWQIYANRLAQWLSFLGYLVPQGNTWLIEDSGKINLESLEYRRTGSKTNRKGNAAYTIFMASPEKTIDALSKLSKLKVDSKLPTGYKNAFVILKRYELIYTKNGYIHSNSEKLSIYSNDFSLAVWKNASKEQSIMEANEILDSANITANDLGERINQKYDYQWSPATIKRVGTGLYQWATWVQEIERSKK